MKQRLSQVEDFGPATDKPAGDRQIAWLESRIAGLEQLFNRPLEMLPLEVSRQLQLIRRQLLDEAASRWKDVAQPMRVEIDDARQRVDALERWLREALAPELVRVQLDLASERRCRERLEKDSRVANQTVRGAAQKVVPAAPSSDTTWSFQNLLPKPVSDVAADITKAKETPNRPGELQQRLEAELPSDRQHQVTFAGRKSDQSTLQITNQGDQAGRTDARQILNAQADNRDQQRKTEVHEAAARLEPGQREQADFQEKQNAQQDGTQIELDRHKPSRSSQADAGPQQQQVVERGQREQADFQEKQSAQQDGTQIELDQHKPSRSSQADAGPQQQQVVERGQREQADFQEKQSAQQDGTQIELDRHKPSRSSQADAGPQQQQVVERGQRKQADFQEKQSAQQDGTQIELDRHKPSRSSQAVAGPQQSATGIDQSIERKDLNAATALQSSTGGEASLVAQSEPSGMPQSAPSEDAPRQRALLGRMRRSLKHRASGQ
ncbi:unnamed protein product [Effrenium voratum]|uniref:Uncharacterized protein n=1 Tax=Effrenium voratum TaxID=2562239 RepID=A0AA36JBW2_9DINO|nr:unnamed protein product [Effrenium voratum]